MAEKDPDQKEELEEKSEEDRPNEERLEKERAEKEHTDKEVAPHELRDRPPHPPHLAGHMPGEEHYYSELNRVVSVLFVGVLALMTFLLTVGLQRPHGMFKEALYTTVVLLPLNLLAYVFGHLFALQAKEAKLTGEAKLGAARKRLKGVRFGQQVLFMLAVLAVAWLAFSAAQFFFNLPANPAQPMQ